MVMKRAKYEQILLAFDASKHRAGKKFNFFNKKTKVKKTKTSIFVAHDSAILMRWGKGFYHFLKKKDRFTRMHIETYFSCDATIYMR